jgi:hypothetical protein
MSLTDQVSRQCIVSSYVTSHAELETRLEIVTTMILANI